MITEAVFWYIVRAISGIVSSFTAYVVLKYLNKKPLAMRTIFDEIIKDFIYFKIFDWLSIAFIDIVINFLIPLDNYLALLIIILRRTIFMAGICQLIAIILVRYLYVFHQTLLNNEILVIFMIRLLVGSIALTSTLTLNLENMAAYYLLTGKNHENKRFMYSTPTLIASMICLIILIVTEYRIEKFKKSVDSQQQLYEIQVMGEEEKRNCLLNYLKKISDRIVFRILFLLLLLFIIIRIFNSAPLKGIYILRLRRISIVNIVMLNIIPLILIVRNQKLFCFFKAQLSTTLRLFTLKKNQIEPIIELNVL